MTNAVKNASKPCHGGTCILGAAFCAVLLASTLLTAPAHGLEFAWAASMGGRCHDEGRAITVDAAGNVYTTGYYQGTVDFDPGPGQFLMTPVNFHDVFVQKLDASGALVWARSIGGTGGQAANGIALDPWGNIVVTGWFQGTVDFDPGPASYFLTSTRGQDGFVLKLDPHGNFIWVQNTTGGGKVVSRAVAVTATGDIYTAGYFDSASIIDAATGAVLGYGSGDNDIFVKQLDPDGRLVWAQTLGGSGCDTAQGIALDDEGNVYVTGRFSGSVDFAPGHGSHILSAQNDSDIFVLKLDADGQFGWAAATSGADHWSREIAVDHAGNVYTTGAFLGTADFDPGPSNHFLVSEGGYEAFVQKLDTHGNLIWARSLGGSASAIGWGLAVDAYQNVFVTGRYRNSKKFGAESAFFGRQPVGCQDAFLLKLDVDGELKWVHSAGGTGQTTALAVTVDDIGNVYATGGFTRTSDFAIGFGGDRHRSSCGRAIFVTKLSDPESMAEEADDDFLFEPDETELAIVAVHDIGNEHGDAEHLAAASGRDSTSLEVALRGMIFDRESLLPIACAVVELTASDGSYRVVAVADLDGEYFIESQLEDAFSVRVMAPGYDNAYPGTVVLDGSGAVRIEHFELVPGGHRHAVAGRVTDANSSAPLVGVLVELHHLSEPYAPLLVDAFTCADGRYEIPLPDAGGEPLSVEVRFSLENYEEQRVQEDLVPASGLALDASLAAYAFGASVLHGSVHGNKEHGQVRIAGALVVVRGPTNSATFTNEWGQYVLEHLQQGSYSVAASAHGFQGAAVQIDLQPGADDAFDFLLAPHDTPPTPADLNADGKVDALDVQLAVNATLKDANSPLTAVDVQLVINAALGIEITP